MQQASFFPWTDGTALHTEFLNIESTLFKYLLKAFRLSIGQAHLLWLSAVFNSRICIWNHSIVLFVLFASI